MDDSFTVTDRARKRVLAMRADEPEPDGLALWVEVVGANATEFVYDMYFQDFVEDQFAVVSDIYAALGLPMTDQAAARMQAFIADNPKGKNGLHLYTPEEYGIDPARVRRDFAPYIERHALAPE